MEGVAFQLTTGATQKMSWLDPMVSDSDLNAILNLALEEEQDN
jgi:hypothetical protein